MPETPARARQMKFGLFELDLDRQELRRDGVPCRLQPQPFTVLTKLVGAGNRVVAREDLRRELWGNETFVDFEQGLNYCIRQIRAALGDDAQNPRYIETLPRKGYRFIAPIEFCGPASADGAQVVPTVVKRSRLRGWPAVTLVALAVALTSAGIYGTIAASRPRLSDKDLIVVADFVNSTSDPAFDDSLKQALTIQLEQSPFLNILSAERVAATEKRMNRGAGRLTSEVAREVCIRSNSKAMLAGSIASMGKHYLLGVTAINCQTGDTLASAESEAEGRDQVLTALENIGNQLRRKLGESLASVNHFKKPLPEATTSSLEALQAYALASPADQPESLGDLQRAIQLDPNFAIAYATLGVRYINFNEPNLASENLKKAYDLHDRVTERERLYIDSAYYGVVTGQLERASEIYRQWILEYPNDGSAYANLAFNYSTMGYYDKCAEIMRHAVQLWPDSSVAIENLTGCLFSLGQIDEAETVMGQSIKQGLDIPDLRLIEYYRAFLRGDQASMDAEAKWAGGKPGHEDIFLSAEADTAAYHGKLREASRLSERAVTSARHNGADETAASWEISDALRKAEFGDVHGAQNSAASALRLNSGAGVRILAALALARSGETQKAAKLADALDREFPLNTMIQAYWLPTIRAAIELDHNNPERAVEILQSAAPYDFAETVQFGYGTMYPVYLRGLAYLKLGQGKDAAAEFQKILDHKSVVVNFPLCSLAYLQLARSELLNQRKTPAQEAFQRFFTLWKDADPDLPVLRYAKAGYSSLP